MISSPLFQDVFLGLGINNLANVLLHQIAFSNLLDGDQTPTPALLSFRFAFGRLALRDLAVATFGSDMAVGTTIVILGGVPVALSVEHAIDAVITTESRALTHISGWRNPGWAVRTVLQRVHVPVRGWFGVHFLWHVTWQTEMQI